MTQQEVITVELEMTKDVCLWNRYYVQIIYPEFDGRGMGDSQHAILTYRLYVNSLDREDHTKAINRKLRALEVICRDKRVVVKVVKGKAFSEYLQDYPLLVKLNQTLAARDD